MPFSPISLLLRFRRRQCIFSIKPPAFPKFSPRPFSTVASSDPKSSLSARLSFVFDQIDAIDRDRAEKDDALQRIRAWRQSKSDSRKQQQQQSEIGKLEQTQQQQEEDGVSCLSDMLKKETEVVHPWPEWIELLERLGHQNYFDRRRSVEDGIAERVGIDLSEVREEVGFDFSRDWTTVRNAFVNFGRDRFDILKSLSRKDLQVLVGHGCPSMDSKVIFSAKLLRKHVRLDEGDVCSSCSLRSSCGRGYILTHKEDEARTLDVMRILLTFGFDHVNGAVENKSLMKMKTVKTVVRKLLHEVVKLSAVPIDPNLPPPVIKKPPPKVKQPPPTPKRRVGRDDVEMKKGDWLCSKCDFMNFAKNVVCLQCDAKRPKRQLLPGEWECPQCNFLNYRRNMACFHCDAKRPEDEFMENNFMANQSGSRTRTERVNRMQNVSNAWNFDFDDNESDGADVAAFEFADSAKMGKDSAFDDLNHGRIAQDFDNDMGEARKMPRSKERGRYFSDHDEKKDTSHLNRTGFDDFDDEEDDDDDVDSYELDRSNDNQAQEVSRKNFSEVEETSGSEEFDDFDGHTKVKGANDYLSGSEDDELSDQPRQKSSHIADSWQKSKRKGAKLPGSSEDIESDSDYDDDMDGGAKSKLGKHRREISQRRGSSRHTIDSDSDDELLLDSDSDGHDDELYSSGDLARGNKGPSDRRMNKFGRQNEYDTARRGEPRSGDRMGNRHNSFENHRDDFSSRGSHGDGYGGKRKNGSFQRFDGLDDGNEKNGRSNQFSDRSRGTSRDGRGSSRNEGRGNDGFRHSSDRSRGASRNERGSERNESRGNDGFRNGSDRSRGTSRDGRGSSKKEWGGNDGFGNGSDRSRGASRDGRGSSKNEWGGNDGFRNASDRSRGASRDGRGSSKKEWGGNDGFGSGSDRSRGASRDGRGSSKKEWGGNDGFRSGSDRSRGASRDGRGSSKKEWGGNDGFRNASDRSRGASRDERGLSKKEWGGNDGFRNGSDRTRGASGDRRGSSRGNDGFRHGRSNYFSDSSSFNDDNGDDRPRKRVIER